MGTSQGFLGKYTKRAIAALGVALLVVGGIPATPALAEEVPPPETQTVERVSVADEGVESTPAADDQGGTTSVPVSIRSLSPETQGVASDFQYLIEFTCSSDRLSCEDVEIDVPFAERIPVANDAEPISQWSANLVSSNQSLVKSEDYWESGKHTRTIKLLAPLEPGTEVSVTIFLTPSRGRVANNTEWEIQPISRAKDAEPSEAPVAVRSRATAAGDMQLTSSVLGGGFQNQFRPGESFRYQLRPTIVGSPLGSADYLFADLTRDYPATVVLPPLIEFVEFPDATQGGTYSPETRTVSWKIGERQHGLGEVILKVADSATAGARLHLDNSASAFLIGETEAVKAQNNTIINVLSNDLVTTALDMHVTTNIDLSTTNDWYIAPEDETTVPATVSTKLTSQHRDTISDLSLTMPCAAIKYGECSDPLTYPAIPQAVTVTRDAGTSELVDVRLTLADGSTKMIKVGATPVSLQEWGEGLQKVEAIGLPHPAGSPAYELAVDFVVPASAPLKHKDWLVEHASANVKADDGSGEEILIEDTRSNEFLRGTLHAALTKTRMIDGWAVGQRGVEISPYTQWAAPLGERREAASQAILLPAGLKFNGFSTATAQYSEIPDFEGTGRTLVRFVGIESMHGGTVMVDTESLAPGLYEYEVFQGFTGFENPTCTALEGSTGIDQDLAENVADVFVDGKSDDACRAVLSLVVSGSKTGHQITNSVRGDLDTQWRPAPGTTRVTGDGTGSAEYQIIWANTGPTDLIDGVVYDILPGINDSGSVGHFDGMPRESDFDVIYKDVVVPRGFTVAYSTSDNPCRPELGSESAGCVDDWTETQPSDLSAVRALRFSADGPLKTAAKAEFRINVSLPKFGSDQAAMNSAAAGASSAGKSESVLSVETPYVGVGGVLRGPDFVATKQSSVREGAPVRPGDVIDYTLTLHNKGTLPGEFAFDDALAGVLDDAGLTAGPEAETDGVGNITAAVSDSDVLELRGALASGETATVTYSVTVTQDVAERGDDVLSNALVVAGETAPDTCEADDKACTLHEIEDIVVEKTAVPESGSAVTGGDTVAYNIALRNVGKLAASPAFTDHLADVLDDAKLTSGPTVDSGEITAELVGEQIEIAGKLAAGSEAVVSYEVEVPLQAADRGDDLLRNTVTLAGEAPAAECAEGSTMCTEHPVEDVVFSKTASPASGEAVKPGDVVTYEVLVANVGTAASPVHVVDHLDAVVDDATLSADPTVTGDGVAAVAEGPGIVISGDLAPGASATVTYSVTVGAESADRGDDVLRNAVTAAGQDPAAECAEGSKTCTEHTVSDLVLAKTANPESGTPVGPGGSVEYSVKVENRGKVASKVAVEDQLAGVLDDAELVGDPKVDVDSVQANAADGVVKISGELAAGAAAVISYQVDVHKDAADRSDDLLQNFVAFAGERPATECAEGSTTCTEHPVEDVVFSKTASPAPGAAVKPGDKVTYTVLVENLGAAASAVNVVDHLAAVLDDATLSGDPKVTGDGVKAVAEGPEIVISGELAAGASATVTYSVTVGAEPADRGDDVLRNAVTAAGKEPAAECAEGSKTCTEHTVSDLVISKTADPASGTAVTPGGSVEYSVKVENRGKVASKVAVDDHLAGVLDDAELTGDPVSDTDGVHAKVDDEVLHVTGELPGGAVAQVSYGAKVAEAPSDRGDDVLRNTVTFAGETPAETCVEGSVTCTQHPVEDIVFSKTASPASGEAVKPGDVVTYEVLVENVGAAASPVNVVDHLAAVLDDATLSTDLQVTGDGVTAAAEEPEIVISGDLAAGASATVTYSVTVGAAAADRGDDVLRNAVTAAGQEPAAECAAGSKTCTEHTVSDLAFTKSANPESGTAVAPGEDVTYTVNVENLGNGTAAVAVVDQLAGVLDDAALAGDPTVAGAGVTASVTGTELAIGGTIPVGASAQVSYTATVKPDGADRGDNVLQNSVGHAGDAAKDACAETDPTCTTHPVESVTFSKTASPASGTEVRAGTEVTYTVTVDNDGATAPRIDLVDLLDGVLDDAKLTGEPKVSGAGLEATLDGGELALTGTVEAGKTATVTYTVTVIADTPAEAPARSLDNFLVPAGAEKPSECVAATGLCTTHPIAQAAPVDPDPPVVVDPPAPPVTPGPKPPVGGGGIATSGSTSGMPILFGGLAAVALGLGLLRSRLRHRG